MKFSTGLLLSISASLVAAGGYKNATVSTLTVTDCDIETVVVTETYCGSSTTCLEVPVTTGLTTLTETIKGTVTLFTTYCPLPTTICDDTLCVVTNPSTETEFETLTQTKTLTYCEYEDTCETIVATKVPETPESEVPETTPVAESPKYPITYPASANATTEEDVTITSKYISYITICEDDVCETSTLTCVDEVCESAPVSSTKAGNETVPGVSSANGAVKIAAFGASALFGFVALMAI
ncbi:uncharacterized protein ASCRUDRAFT_125724 [Ascoidea rubescens DSM 1968]|uniref:Uncharacterized protein n=1 Tax=Ascoidea rubescens DSM 1968 TaxID=1344418 RepID=A0A1D2VN02_9ASCO|nr:hypothetical protein ASCRUDRAFT_125724 [Ascoidea rubescens DSM 1968]ODV62947.1 hypothetical protein ASCRUDRAFT_125724 [Ascoidea rubescens DSM 1968]